MCSFAFASTLTIACGGGGGGGGGGGMSPATSSPTFAPGMTPTPSPIPKVAPSPTSSPIPTATPTPSGPTAALSALPNALSFGGVGSANAQTFTAVGGAPITVVATSTCLTDAASLGQAAVSPRSGASGQVFTVTPATAGTCSFTLSDASGASIAVSVAIATTTVTGQ